MKKLLLYFFIILFTNSIVAQKETTANKTTYYFIRHAEKTISAENKDPDLTELGYQRAESLITIFKHVTFDAIYSTNYKRTKNTGIPLANNQGISLTIYDPFSFDLYKFTHDSEGKTILIIGHSNTIPNMVNTIIEKDVYETIDEDEYNNLYQVITIGDYTTHKLLKLN